MRSEIHEMRYPSVPQFMKKEQSSSGKPNENSGLASFSDIFSHFGQFRLTLSELGDSLPIKGRDFFKFLL